MTIELAGIQLNRVHRIATLERATLVQHRVPGLEGNLVQDLGRDSVQLQIEGIFYGTTAADDLEALRGIYKNREPVDFLSAIAGQAYFGQVVLERFEVRQLAQEPDQFSYRLTITEYVPPPQPETPVVGVPEVDASIVADAQNYMDSVTGALDALDTLSVPDFADPTPPLRGALDGVKEALDGLSSVATGLTELFGGGG
jgi:DNA circularisation protein N-terminus